LVEVDAVRLEGADRFVVLPILGQLGGLLEALSARNGVGLQRSVFGRRVAEVAIELGELLELAGRDVGLDRRGLLFGLSRGVVLGFLLGFLDGELGGFLGVRLLVGGLLVG